MFILGGGPSLRLLEPDFSPVRGRRVIAVNNAYGDVVVGQRKRTPQDGKWFADTTERYEPRDWVDACWFGDGRWFPVHKQYLQKFPGLIAHCAPSLREVGGLCHYIRGKQHGIDDRPEYVSWNKSSGGSAINFAYHLGARTIVLLGFDMRRVDDQANWHMDHIALDKDPYYRFLRPFPAIAADCKSLGVKVINATPGSAIQVFPIMTLQEFLESEHA